MHSAVNFSAGSSLLLRVASHTLGHENGLSAVRNEKKRRGKKKKEKGKSGLLRCGGFLPPPLSPAHSNNCACKEQHLWESEGDVHAGFGRDGNVAKRLAVQRDRRLGARGRHQQRLQPKASGGWETELQENKRKKKRKKSKRALYFHVPSLTLTPPRWRNIKPHAPRSAFLLTQAMAPSRPCARILDEQKGNKRKKERKRIFKKEDIGIIFINLT
jgi:hypothetical protein